MRAEGWTGTCTCTRDGWWVGEWGKGCGQVAGEEWVGEEMRMGVAG